MLFTVATISQFTSWVGETVRVESDRTDSLTDKAIFQSEELAGVPNKEDCLNRHCCAQYSWTEETGTNKLERNTEEKPMKPGEKELPKC